MRRAGSIRALVVALVALAGGCKKEEARSLLQVDVTAPTDGEPEQVNVVVSQAGGKVAGSEFAWTAGKGGTAKLGLYLGAEVVGPIEVAATGQDRSGPYAAVKQPATVVKGKTTGPVRLTLVRAPVGPGDDAGAEKIPTPDAGAPVADAAPDRAADEPAAVDGAAESPPPEPVERKWELAENIENDLLSKSLYPDVAMNRSNGDAVIAWVENTGPVKARRYDAYAKTWSEAKVVSEATGEWPVVAVAPNGHALIVWSVLHADDVNQKGTWAVHSTDGGRTWGAPRPIRRAPAQYATAEAVILASGDARAVWAEGSVGDYTIFTAFYSAQAGTWSAPAMLSKPPTEGDATEYQLAVDDKGAGLITWRQRGLWGALWNGPDVQPAQLLDPSTDAKDAVPVVAPQGGRAVAVYAKTYELWVNEHVAGAWKGATRVVGGGSVFWPAPILDATGALTVAWAAYASNSRYNVAFVRQPAAGQPWSSPEPLETTNFSSSVFGERPAPVVAADGAGNVHMAWRRQLEGTMGIVAVVRSWVDGKLQPERIFGAKPTLSVSPPVIAGSEGGAAVALFYYFGQSADPSQFNLFASFYR